MSGFRLASKHGEIRTGPQANFRLCRLPVRPEKGQGQTHLRSVANINNKNQRIINRTNLSGQATDVPHRAGDSHRKTGPPRVTSHEAHTVAPQKQLEGLRVTRKGNTSSQVVPPSSKMVAGGKQCASWSTITPTKTCSASVYRCIKRRMGCSLKLSNYNLVPSTK